MYDPTPAPFGDVTRRWTALDTDERRRQAARLLGFGCAGDAVGHVDRPGLDAGACVADASDGAISVRVTATPGALEIDPGDGSGSFACTSQLAYDPNTSYYDQVPGEPRGACVHVYQQVLDEVTATMSVTWTVTYDGFAPELGSLSGSLGTQTRQQTATFPVKEIQSVIVR
ncbi:hypothetical protein [Euzebya sp.]|uniref:hypothetical protein n=1 Tax=Euzebya sp. TaxID=1971409 RepID=UPI0035197E1B